MGRYDLEIAYDVYGDEVTCDCGGQIFFDPNSNIYICPECGHTRSRRLFAEMAGLDLDLHCLNECENNYPFCRHACEYWDMKEFGY